jgi:parallel beta-helix repeat protein
MKTSLARRMAAVMTMAMLAGSLLATVAAPGIALAAVDPGCTALGGADGAGTCDVSAPVNVSGTITVAENLHLLAGAVLTVTPGPFTLNVDPGNLEMDGGSSILGPEKSITINVPHGNMTMHNGSLIKTTSTANGGAAGPVTIHVGNYPNIPPAGVFTMETGSTIEANGGSSGVGGDIVITAGRSGDIDGHVLSQVNTGSSGTGAVQGRDGASIFVDTGCGLRVSGTGVLSSRGQDAAADLVHLSSCEVTIEGLVESTGPGHAVPNSPPNHCDATFRPGKPAHSTGCVEVWADNITITNTGEINADVNSTGAGGTTGQSWIDLFANTNIAVTGRTSGNFSAHADSYSGSDASTNTVTAKAVHGTFSGSGRLFSASDSSGNGSYGGDVVVEASAAVTLDTGTVMAAGDNVGGGNTVSPCDGGSGACGQGGRINVRSWNAGISWQNGVGDVNPDNGVSPPAGAISLTACTTVTTTGTNFDSATPTVVTGSCGGNPVLPSAAASGYDVVFQTAIWTACRFQSPLKEGLKFNDLNGNGVYEPLGGETPIADWPINLLTTANVLVTPTTTAADGTYSFVIADPGSYRVCEGTGPAGYVQTAPNALSTAPAGESITSACPAPNTYGYQFTVAGGENLKGNDFGNRIPPVTCKEDPNRAALLTRTVNPGKPAGGAGVPGAPANYLTVQAAYNAARDSQVAQNEVIGLSSNTTENLVLDGAKAIVITQCDSARVTAADNSKPVWQITNTKKLLIIGPDSVGGTIGWELLSGGHELKSIRANGASVAGVRISSNGNAVSWNAIAGNPIGLDVLGSTNVLKGSTIGPNSGSGVHFGPAATGNSLSGATIQDNAGNGIWIEGSSNTISSNKLYRNLNGIQVSGSSNTISSNTSESNTGAGADGDGIKVSGKNNQFKDNKESKNRGDGFEVALITSTGNKLTSNASNNGSSGGSSENVGFEYRFVAAIVNGGSNKKDGASFASTAINTYE